LDLNAFQHQEFIACQRENAGLLILSEFAGAAEELFNALIQKRYSEKQATGRVVRSSSTSKFITRTCVFTARSSYQTPRQLEALNNERRNNFLEKTVSATLFQNA
jgi:hypothetical protein